MRYIIASIVCVIIALFYIHGPEVIQFHPYWVYKEIKCLQERVKRLENK